MRCLKCFLFPTLYLYDIMLESRVQLFLLILAVHESHWLTLFGCQRSTICPKKYSNFDGYNYQVFEINQEVELSRKSLFANSFSLEFCCLTWLNLCLHEVEIHISYSVYFFEVEQRTLYSHRELHGSTLEANIFTRCYVF